jgi:hypothetical protein
MISTTARSTALALSLGLFGACQSAKSKSEGAVDAGAANKSVPYDPHVWDKGPPDPLGAFLADLDKSMRAWTNLTLTAQTRGDKTKASLLQQDLMKRVHTRQKELVDALETGPPRNRAIAAGALGFSTSPKDVQGPLVVALADKDTEVVQNAALSLALLQDRETPLLPLLEVLQSSTNGRARANAGYAVRTILEAGAPASEDVIKAARNALVDSEPFAQAQGALILALAKDGASVPDLTEMLRDKSPLVVGAATQALLCLGRADSKLLGPTARGLVVGLGTASEDLRPSIQRALVLLSGHNYADDVKQWTDWSQRLP